MPTRSLSYGSQMTCARDGVRAFGATRPNAPEPVLANTTLTTLKSAQDTEIGEK